MKKVFSLVIVVFVFVLSLCSCSILNLNLNNDPITLAKKFDEKDYAVTILIDDKEIEGVADDLEVRSSGISCIVGVCPNDGDDINKLGMFIYCNDKDSAEKMVKDHLTSPATISSSTEQIPPKDPTKTKRTIKKF